MDELAKKMKALAGIQENNKRFLKNDNFLDDSTNLNEAEQKKFIVMEFEQEEVEPGEDDEKLYKIK